MFWDGHLQMKLTSVPGELEFNIFNDCDSKELLECKATQSNEKASSQEVLFGHCFAV